MDAFELRDQLVAAMPDSWVGLVICTVYDDDHQVLSIRVSPDLSTVESEAEVSYLIDPHSMKDAFGAVMRVWLDAPPALRHELTQLLNANGSLSDEDGVVIVRTALDLGLATKPAPADPADE